MEVHKGFDGACSDWGVAARSLLGEGVWPILGIMVWPGVEVWVWPVVEVWV